MPQNAKAEGTSTSWGGVFSSVLDPNPRAVGEGVQGGAGWHKASVLGCLPLAARIGLSPRGGGVQDFSSGFEAFLNSLFHSEHLQYTEAG